MAAFNWRDTSAVVGEAAPLADLKKQLEIAQADTAHDGQLTAYLEAAKKQFEAATRYLIGTRDVTITIDHFADTPLYLPIRPINSLADVVVNGTSVLASLTTDLNSEPARIYPTSYTWSTTTEPIANIVITCNAGKAVATLPQDIKQSLLLLAATWFEYREDMITGASVSTIPLGVKAIWDSYRLADGYLIAMADGGSSNG